MGTPGCKSYKIPEFDIDFPDEQQETDDVPLFLRSDKNLIFARRENMPRMRSDMQQSSPNAGATTRRI